MDTNEKRLMEAFAQYETGTSLATLQAVFSDVAVELNQMVEADRMLKQGREAMRPSPELGRKVVAALALRQRERDSSIFMSGLWRLAAPVGVAALSFLFIISSQHNAQISSVAIQEMNTMTTRMAAPMMAKNTDTSLMAIEAPAADSVALMASDDGAGADIVESSIDTLYLWQRTALILLVVLSVLVLVKHWLVRRR